MTPVHVKITDKNLKVIMDLTFDSGCSDFDTLSLLHTEMEKQYPDCFVNFSWGDSFICGQPINMKLDEIAMENGTVTWEEYQEKWYSPSDETEEDKWVRNVETRAELHYLMN